MEEGSVIIGYYHYFFFVTIELQAIFTTFSWVETFDKGRESVSGKENSTTQTLEMIGHLGQVQIVKFGWNLEQIGRLIVGISLQIFESLYLIKKTYPLRKIWKNMVL